MNKNPRYSLIIGILLCLFTIPALAQEGRFHGNPKANAKFESGSAKQTASAEEKIEPQAPKKPADFSELRSQGTVTVDQVIDPVTIRLTDGRIVSLTSITIEDSSATSNGQTSEAYEALKKLIEKKPVTFYQVKNENAGQRNRMGHYLGHLETREGQIWVQGYMLLNGYARIQPSQTNTEMASQMLALENDAIKAKVGLWSEEKHTLLTPETAEKSLNSWGIVEGRILKSAMNNNTVYLNFADDWRKDFSIGIDPEIRRQMAKANINPLDLNGKSIRIRGWIESYNGPFIRLSHAAWLEILPENTQQDKLPPDTKEQ